jgi:hypothetical protein
MTARRTATLLAAGSCAIVLGAPGAVASASGSEEQAAAPGTAPSPTVTAVTAPVPAAPSTAPTDVRLSNERTTTTWAHPLEEKTIFAVPDTHSRHVSHVHLMTEDGFPEVYLLLARHVDAQGRTWLKVRIPGRPNGRRGWVLRSAFGGLHVTHWAIVVNRRKRTLTAYYKGKVRMRAPVGVGKPSTPTPPGHFWIRERFRIAERSNPYWPYALGTADYSTLSEWPGGGVVGIHGDYGAPQLIPGDPSHGCIRMHDSDIGWLAPRITLGTPVDVL